MSRKTRSRTWKKRIAKEWLILFVCVGSVWGFVAVLIVMGRQKFEYVDVSAPFEFGIMFYGITLAVRSVIWACRTLMKNSNSDSDTVKERSQFSRN
jgi:hypothetical protein